MTLIGRLFGHYRIVARLGAGGMGEVYRARDEHLERDVAVKVLPVHLVADASARRRLRREALALSRAHHPHIVTVFDFDEHDGVAYLVMELVEGETLADRISRGALGPEAASRMGAEIASALVVAHGQGIVHGDLTPRNVLLDRAGRSRVVDFGIARHIPGEGPSSMTTTEIHGPRGTVPYMAPEVLLGEPSDGRADLFSLGVLLHEAAIGSRPHSGETSHAVAAAILHRDAELSNELPPGLRGVIERCLARNPDQRFAAAGEVEAALRGETAGASPTATAVPPSRRHNSALPPRARMLPKWALAIVLALVTVAAAWLLRDRLFHRSSSIDALAVLPLRNMSGDAEQEYFADGMTEELIVRLSQVAALRVIANSSSAQFKGTQRAPREIARELDVDALITGSVQRSGRRIRIHAEMVDARTGRALWADSYEREIRDVLALQGELAQAIVSQAQVALRPRERTRLAAAPPVNPVAHESYLRGRFYWHKFTEAGWSRAREEFERAIEADPTYAPAYVGLSDTYALLSGFTLPTSEAMARAKSAATRALDLDPDLPSAHASLGYVLANHERQWQTAESHYRRALALNPNELTALQNLGYLNHVHGRFEEAVGLFRRAKRIDPLSVYVQGMNIWPLNQGRKYPEAIAASKSMLAADSTAWYPRFLLGQALLHAGRTDEGIRELERALAGENLMVARCWLGYAYGIAGRAELARRHLRTARESATPNAYGIALMYLGLGDRLEALRWLERGVDERTEEVHFMAVDPAMDPLRSEPRFRALLDRIGLSEVNPFRAWTIPREESPTSPTSDRLRSKGA